MIQFTRRVMIQFATPIERSLIDDRLASIDMDTILGISDVTTTDSSIGLTLRGPMGPLLKWLNDTDVADLQIESGGLLTLYRQIHDGEQPS